MNDAGRVMPIAKGDYDSSVEYEALDFVYYNDASWIAKQTTRNNLPSDNSEYWQRLTSSSNFGVDAEGYITVNYR